MQSVRQVAACLGISGRFEIIRDFYGYRQQAVPVVANAPTVLSLRTHLERLTTGGYININVIRVGFWNNTRRSNVDAAIHFAREILWQAFDTIGRVSYYHIEPEDWNGNNVIDSQLEVENMMMAWSVPNDGIDCFFVTSTTTGFVGLGPPGGRCDKGSIVKDGIMVSLSPSTVPVPAMIGNTLVHELGHFFWLPHHSNNGNVMWGDGGGGFNPVTSTELDAFQISTFNLFCAIKGPCET